MALPNPQEAVRLQGESVVTLKDLLHFQEETNKWSKNTDVNTFRAQVDIKKFSEATTPNTPLATNEGIQKSLEEEGDKTRSKLSQAEKDRIKQTRDDPFERLFNVITKPFKRLSENLDGTKFQEFGQGFTNIASASERANAGFKELTNGIGELGPMFNTLKTQAFKLVAGFNVLLGIFQLIGAGLRGLFNFTSIHMFFIDWTTDYICILKTRRASNCLYTSVWSWESAPVGF